MINEHREIGWRINLDAIHQAFLKTISVFPDSDGAQYEVQKKWKSCCQIMNIVGTHTLHWRGRQRLHSCGRP